MIFLERFLWMGRGSPNIYINYYYEKRRSGTTMQYRLRTIIEPVSGESYFGYNILQDIVVNGQYFVAGAQIKAQNPSQWTADLVYTTDWVSVYNKVNGTTPVAIKTYSTQTNRDQMKEYDLDVDYAAPVISINLNSRTHNSITINYNSTGHTSPTKIDVYNGNTYLGTGYSNPFTISGLTPKTNYSNVRARGYSSAGWGNYSNSLNITTYPTPVSVTNATISNVLPFQATVGISVSNFTDTSTIEFDVIDSGSSVVASYNAKVQSWTAMGLTPETMYRFRIRARTNTSNVWSSYFYSNYFTTTSDQSQGWVVADGAWRKGKIFINTGTSWEPAKKTFIKDGNNWKETTNN